MTGQDDDSISTLGNNTVAGRAFIPRTIGAISRGSPSSGSSVSDQSFATMDTRVSQIEQNIKTMESNIAASVNRSMEELLKKFSTNMKEPAGADTGRSND